MNREVVYVANRAIAIPSLILASDSFTFVVTDGITESSIGSIHIDVVNSPPRAVNETLTTFWGNEILVALNGYACHMGMHSLILIS